MAVRSVATAANGPAIIPADLEQRLLGIHRINIFCGPEQADNDELSWMGLHGSEDDVQILPWNVVAIFV